MRELVLKKEIEWGVVQTSKQRPGEVLKKRSRVAVPGEGDHLHLLTLPAQVLYQHAVVEKASSNGLQAPIDNETYPHPSSFLKDAQASVSSHTLTVVALRLGALMRSVSAVQRMRERCSMLGLSPSNSGRSFRVCSL